MPFYYYKSKRRFVSNDTHTHTVVATFTVVVVYGPIGFFRAYGKPAATVVVVVRSARARV